MAFSNASRVMIRLGRRSSSTIATMRLPASCAISKRRASTAGQVADPESCMPRASATLAIVDAVPMVMQWPADRAMQPSATWQSASDMRPAATSASNAHT